MINSDKTIQLFNEHSVTDSDTIIVFGQFHPDFIKKRTVKKFYLYQKEKNIKSSKVFISGKKRDFCLVLPKFSGYEKCNFSLCSDDKEIFQNIFIKSPFKIHDESQQGAVIITMVKNYQNRILEWIDYHLKLGFSKIVIFNNNSSDQTEDLINKLNDKRVDLIPFNYHSFDGFIYDEIQRMAISIGFSQFKNCFGWTCLIDADEFICLPNSKSFNIIDFLQNPKFKKHPALVMKSKVLTNKNSDDQIKNNIIDLCRYSNLKPLYTKIFVNNSKTKKTIFIKSPHKLRFQHELSMEQCYHCHCWCNERLEYKPEFVQRNELLTVKNK